MNSSVYRCSRVEKTNNVDITAHLSSIRDLETKMAEYHRCDRVPAWAESLIHRVELLESAISKGHCDPGTATLPLRSVATTSNLSIPEKATIFDHMLDRQRTHFNSQIISSRLFLDSQIEMITFELERLHNLMTIRPTTADLQLLASSLHDVHRRMYDSFDDIAAGIGSSVQEKVAKEMEIFLQQLGTNERSNTKRIQVALDKTERISKSILELSEVSSAAIDDVISDAEETKVMITNLRKEILADMSELREVMMSNQNAAQETLNDLHQRCADERFHSILKNVSDMKETVESLKTELLFDPDELRLNSHVMKGTTNQVVASIIQKLGRSSTFTENGQDPVTILPLLDKHSEAIRVTTTLLKNVEERVAAVGVLQAKSQLQEEELLYEIKALQKHREDMEVASRTTIQAQAHITGLNDRSLEHNTAIAQIEGHLKSVQNDIANVSAISFENEARLLAVSKDVAGFESRILGVIDVIKAVCLEFITEKHEELVKRCIFL